MPIKSKYYPTNKKMTKTSNDIEAIFKKAYSQISTPRHHLKSNQVLSVVKHGLESIGFDVEKPRIPLQASTGLTFNVDAFLRSKGYLIEVEAGRAIENNQFLKDLVEACVIDNVNYLCIAVPNCYTYKCNKKDVKKNVFEKVCDYMDAIYNSNRVVLPVKGILIIGY